MDHSCLLNFFKDSNDLARLKFVQDLLKAGVKLDLYAYKYFNFVSASDEPLRYKIVFDLLQAGIKLAERQEVIDFI